MINVHSHHYDAQAEVLVIQSGLLHFQELLQNYPEAFFSLGIHPWEVDEKSESQISDLERLIKANRQRVIAIGECGLDKVCTTDYNLQERVFVQQIKLANELQMPLVIHSVKAHAECISLLKKCNNTQHVLIHGLSGKWSKWEEWEKYGAWISFGKSLMNENPDTQDSITRCNREKILLETDDAHASIEEVAEKARLVLKLEKDELQKLIKNNYAKFISV